MADLYSRNVNTKFSGLTTTIALFGVVGTIALVGFETLRQMRRLPKTRTVPFWSKDPIKRQGGPGGIASGTDPGGGDGTRSTTRQELTCEDWEMGHLYLARQFHHTSPSPTMARWPFAWAFQALKLNDWFYATHTGMDTVVYVRFLRACFWWIVLQTLTTAPTLLAIHLHFAVQSNKGTSLSLNDMSEASLSYLVTTTICKCANGSVQRTPCDNSNSSSKSQIEAYRNCDHVPNEAGRKLLWVHLILLWYITATWFYALWWIARGSLRIRRRWVNEIRIRRQAAVQANASAAQGAIATQDVDDSPYVPPYAPLGQQRTAPQQMARGYFEEKHGFANLVRGDDHDGWRQRTLLVTNLPPTMRDEASIRRYFEEFLRPDDGDSLDSTEQEDKDASMRAGASDASPDAAGQEDAGAPSTMDRTTATDLQAREGNSPSSSYHAPVEEPHGPEPDLHPDRHLRSPVQTVVLVRKMNELSSMLSRRQEVLSKLEAAHIQLARTVLTRARKDAKAIEARSKAKRHTATHGKRPVLGIFKHGSSEEKSGSDDVEEHAAVALDEEKRRVDELVSRLSQFLPARRQQGAGGQDNPEEKTETIWEALADVPRELLDPYQPVTRLSSLFRGQKVPTIDYLLTKLNLLTALVTEMRARPPSSYEATSTAFVTFRDPRQARMVWRELKTQIVVKVRLAPEVKDLDWERLMRTSFTGNIVRGIGVNVFFWLFTILWVIPVTLLTTALFSVDKLEAIFPVLNTFFRNNPRFEGFVSVTLPTLVVSLLTLCIPELIFQISKRAQGFVTFSALYDQCLCRYWKFIICNVLIFFCLGATTVQSVIFQLGTNNNVLNAVAFSFPTAAPFYISYLILGMAMHTGFELLGFMVPLIQHLGARNAITPRIRALKTLPRNFNRYYWLPLHMLIMSIVFLFALLNPLIIPFSLPYIWVALVVFKKNLAFQYFRRFNEKEGVVYFKRLLRFSLDGLLVAQVVILIFFSVTRQEVAYIALTAVLIPINVIVKLLGTRLWLSQCRAIEDEEANALCGIGESTASTMERQPTDHTRAGSSDSHLETDAKATLGHPIDARASGRYPAVVTLPPTSSRLVNLWNKIHDSFNANGLDRPSYVSSQHMHGSHFSAKTVTQAVANIPLSAAKRTARRSKNIVQATTGGGKTVPASDFQLRRSLAVSSTFPTGKGDEREAKSSGEAPPAGGPLTGASARDLRKMLEGSDKDPLQAAGDKVRSSSLRHRKSTSHRLHSRGDDAPFLSGYETITAHAPIAESDDGSISSYGDGEYEELLSLQRRQMAVDHRRRRSHRQSSFTQDRRMRENSLPNGAAPERDQAAHPLSDARDTDVSSAEKEPATDIHKSNSDLDSVAEGPLVKPHAKVQWDDTPNNHARYNNPFYGVELDPFLWLPREPMASIDLCDTIEWYGAALVSSQGGMGRIGEWEEEMLDYDGAEETSDQSNISKGDLPAVLREGPYGFRGDEEIEISGTLAQRIKEADDVDSNVDPGASIPRNMMGDYKRALEEEGEEALEDGDDAGSLPPASRLHRRRSSAARRPSFRSEDGEFGTLERQTTTASTGQEDGVHADTSLHPTSPNMAHSGSGGLHRQATSFSIRSRGSMNSTGNGTARRITMRDALMAEVLEEEHRHSIKDRLSTKKRGGGRRSDRFSAAAAGPGAAEIAMEERNNSASLARRHQKTGASREVGNTNFDKLRAMGDDGEMETAMSHSAPHHGTALQPIESQNSSLHEAGSTSRSAKETS